MGRRGLYWKDRKGEKWMEEGMEKGEVRVGKIPSFSKSVESRSRKMHIR